MYERFTDPARKVMQFANEEVLRFNCEYMDTEHILLSLVRVAPSVAVFVLKRLDVDLQKIRLEVQKLAKTGIVERIKTGKVPKTSQTEKLIEYAMEEACNLKHNYVGTEHLLLGLLREPEGVGGYVLRNLGLVLGDVRKEVLDALGVNLKLNSESEQHHLKP